VRASRRAGSETTFIMVTAFASMDTAIESLKAGAADYVTKPVRNEEILHRLAQIESLRGLRSENRALRKFVAAGEDEWFRFASSSMQETERLVSKVAPTDSTVLITGESGTGKSLIARQLHELSPRRDGPFIPVNCSAIPENLLESEFFGHTKGAFTSADRARKGLFLQADRGTIFLDEVGELPLPMQTKLLHVIEDKQVRPIGGEVARRVDVRIVCATNRNLPEMVTAGRFREDLYYRLGVFHLPVPPLRDRREDLRGLIGFLLGRMQRASAAGKPVSLDPVAEEVLLGYPWPGNVRELDNVLHRAYILADGGVIMPGDLPPELSRPAAATEARPGMPVAEGKSLRAQLRRFEIEIIQRALEECGGDRKAAAEKLGIGLSSLYRKLEQQTEEG
jgi:two-component system response regulator AtoC